MEQNTKLRQQFPGVSARLLPFLEQANVTDILINGTQSLYVEEAGKLSRRENPFPDVASLWDLMERMLVPIGKRVDAANPYADGRLVDGSRFHLLLPPVAMNGPFISIRKYRNQEDATLDSFGPPETIQWLREQVISGKNFIIAGATGSGKTTLLCRLLDSLPENERITVLEETREIRTTHPHAIFLEARPPSPDGVGEVSLRTLVKQTLRMRPDRIVVGEVRGEEAFDLLQALNTGHRGVLGTLHANSALDALRRLETLAILVGYNLPLKVLREWIGANIQGVIHLSHFEGRRQISQVLEVQGLEGEAYRVTPRFRSPCKYSQFMQN